MDMPIYLEFSHDSLGRRWAAILEDEKNKAQAEGESGDELMIHNNGKDRVSDLDLPNLDPTIQFNCIAAAGPRLFVIGGYSEPPDDEVDNEILQIDLEQSPPSWKRSDEHPIGIPKYLNSCCASAFSDGDWIYVVGCSELVRFHRLDVNRRNSFPGFPPTSFPPILLGITASSKILLIWRVPGGAVQLVSYELESGSLQIIDESLPWCSHEFASVVLVRDSYLICFAHCHPAIKNCPHPALYVYDLGRRQWLPEPVQGLANNGIALPLYQEDVIFASLMQVRRAELKFALLWTFYEKRKTSVHWSKFTLAIQENVDRDIAPTFHAKSLYSGACFFPSDTGFLINSTAG